MELSADVATCVHLAPAKSIGQIKRSGIHKSMRGVFCLPVVPNYYASHQWVRELKRRGQRMMVAVYFHLPDEENVSVGRYNEPHKAMTAAEASAHIMSAPDPLGYEVIVPRTIKQSELRKIRAVPHVVGWRCMPGSHRRPLCQCEWCIRGEIKARRRKRYHEKRFPVTQ